VDVHPGLSGQLAVDAAPPRLAVQRRPDAVGHRIHPDGVPQSQAARQSQDVRRVLPGLPAQHIRLL
jgi:hypothetical protein